MARIRFIDLPAAPEVFSDDVLPVDGATTRKATPAQIVDIGRPMASEAQAIAGVANDVGMSPLTTKQAIDAQPAFTGDSGSGGTKGMVPAPAAGNGAAGYYLKADGTWGIPPEGNVGDVEAWNAAIEYEANAAVSYDGKIYGALSANINKTPGVDPEWDFIVGATGGSFSTKVTVPVSTAISAGFNLGGNGVAPSSPVDGDIWGQSNELRYRIASATVTIQTNNIKYATPPSLALRAGFNIDNGTAPSSPVAGDMWATGNGLYWRIGGATNRVLTNNDFTSFPAGVQIGYGDVTSFASATITGAGNVVTFDNNPFLITEGTEIASFSYACKLATGSKLILEAQVPIGSTTTGYGIIGMFRGSTLVGVGYINLENPKTDMFFFRGSVAAHPGNTSSATYSLRAAVATATDSYIVNNSSSTIFGGNQIGVVFSLREVKT